MRRFLMTTDAEIALARSWSEDDDQRQVERLSGGAEVEIPRPEAGEEMDVGEQTSHSQYHSRCHNQFPQFEWVDHRAQEHEPDQVQEQMLACQIHREPRPEEAR